MTVQRTIMTYRADELDMVATLYLDDAGEPARPGVLLFPEAFGPGPNVHDRAARLAGLGYAALACDLHGGAKLCEQLEEALPLIGPLLNDPARTRARGRGALEALGRHPAVDSARIAAIGFCFGGTMSLELGRGGAAIAAIVGFHSGLATSVPDDARNIACPVLVCIGADDPAIPPAQRAAFEAEMNAGGVDWTMHLYGGVVHSFTNRAADAMGRPDFARYDPDADAQSWSAMIQLFDRAFG